MSIFTIGMRRERWAKRPMFLLVSGYGARSPAAIVVARAETRSPTSRVGDVRRSRPTPAPYFSFIKLMADNKRWVPQRWNPDEWEEFFNGLEKLSIEELKEIADAGEVRFFHSDIGRDEYLNVIDEGDKEKMIKAYNEIISRENKN